MAVEKKLLTFLFFLFGLCFNPFQIKAEPHLDLDKLSKLPCSYKGRFRPLEAYSKLWLEDIYRGQQLEPKLLASAEESNSPSLYLLLYTHFNGHLSLNETPKDSENLSLSSAQQNLSKAQFNTTIENQFPLSQRLLESGSTLKMLPSRYKSSECFSLKALTLKNFDPSKNQSVPVSNFTSFSNEDFGKIQTAYLELEQAFLSSPRNNKDLNIKINHFADAYKKGYFNLQKTPYQSAHNHALYYPTDLQLAAEVIYTRYPLFEICLSLYILSFILFSLYFFNPIKVFKGLSLTAFLTAFAFHSLILGVRSYILQRPPVANMFETVIYVPWIAVLTSLILGCYFKNMIILSAANMACLTLLILLKLAGVNNSLDTIQAVLNSNFWLTIHVLMVVGSYGLFCLSGILGHFYLVSQGFYPHQINFRTSIGKLISQSMYLGLLLLIAGTILGGVWAAESWGRFWDWDPKESWAFISICVYLTCVHAYMFKHIGETGLAIGSIVGLQAISFTWYGVNYILGTGLHSYGFGSGGEHYYYLYLAVETLFIIGVLRLGTHSKNLKLTKSQ